MKREMDQKSPNVTRGQAAEYFGLSKNALRNYETMCLVDPQVGENGYRYYHEEDISALSTIRMYRDMGYTLESIQQLMRSPSLQNLSELFDEHQKELFAMVDCGCTVVDVIVEHPVYGQLTAPLALSSRYDVEQFIHRMKTSHAQPISALTGGVHLHTLSCPSEAVFAHLKETLADMGMLYDAN